MRHLLSTFLFAIVMMVSCESPVQGIVIDPPSTHPDTPGSTQQPGGTTEPGTTEIPTVTSPDGYVIVGYATYWDSTMPDPSLLTHINYSFAHIKNDFESLDIKTESRLIQIAALKKKNPNLKVVLSIGGWEAGNFSEMAADDNHRKNFCKNCRTAVNKYNLDGIDLDWEYPTSSSAGISSSPDDTKNFTQLVKDLRTTLGSDKLITMASSASAKYVDFKSVIGYLNWVNLMTYDMGRPPYHHNALHKSAKTKRSCEESVELHYAAGVPYAKMTLGIPFYGKGASSSDDKDYNEIDFSNSSYNSSIRRRMDEERILVEERRRRMDAIPMEEDLAPFSVQNHAFGGSTDKDLLFWAPYILYPYSPKIVFFQTGSNDYVESPAETEEEKIAEAMDFKHAMFSEFHKKLPDAIFVVMSGILLPGRSEYVDMTLMINDRLKEYCAERDYMLFVDAEALTYDRAKGSFVENVNAMFLEDQIHLTDAARIIWANTWMRPLLQEIGAPVKR